MFSTQHKIYVFFIISVTKVLNKTTLLMIGGAGVCQIFFKNPINFLTLTLL